jgi:hypothetical protein
MVLPYEGMHLISRMLGHGTSLLYRSCTFSMVSNLQSIVDV